MKRKVNPNSVYMMNKYREAGLSKERVKWTNEENDLLLDAFLKGYRYESSRACLRSVTGRSERAVESQLWKLSVRYDRKSVREYKSNRPVVPHGGRVTMPELVLIERMTSAEGVANGADDFDWVAKILARPRPDAERLFKSLTNKVISTTFFTPDLSMTVHAVVKGAYKRYMTEIGLKP